MNSGSTWAVVADDLTGCLDTAVAFLRPGSLVRAGLLPLLSSEAERALADVPTIALDAETRHSSGEATLRVWRSAVEKAQELGAQRLYLKLDSMLRAETLEQLAIARHWTDAPCLVCPAVPAQRRRTVGGVQFDGAKAVPGGRLLDLLKPYSIAAVSLETVRRGWESVARALDGAHSRRFIVADAESSGDLETIARALTRTGWPGVPAGASGLAAALAREQRRGQVPRFSFEPDGLTLVVSASYRNITRAQIRALLETGRAEQVALEPTPSDFSREEQRAVDGIAAILRSRRVPVLTEPEEPGGEEDPTFADLLGAVACAAILQLGLKQIVLVGGDTSWSVLRRLDPWALELLGQAESGVPGARLIGGPADGLKVITKSGGFGTRSTLRKLALGDR